jgi:hypothetical protein
MKFSQNQKWVSIKAEELNKRIEQKGWVHTKEQLEWNKERQMRMDFQEANSKASTNKKGESSSNVWVLSNAHLGKISKKGFLSLLYILHFNYLNSAYITTYE